MADPLSVSASIAGLITVAESVFGLAFKYIKAVNGAPKEVGVLASSIGTLSGILHNLLLVTHQIEGETFDTTIQINHIASCHQTIAKVKKILDKFESSSDTGQMERMKKMIWPFCAAEAKSLTREIEQHTSTLSVALSVDSMSGLLQALSRQKDIQSGLDDVKRELRQKREAETRISINQENRVILNWIQPHDPHPHHNMSLKLRHPHTGLWLIEGEEVRMLPSDSPVKDPNHHLSNTSAPYAWSSRRSPKEEELTVTYW